MISIFMDYLHPLSPDTDVRAVTVARVPAQVVESRNKFSSGYVGDQTVLITDCLEDALGENIRETPCF